MKRIIVTGDVLRPQDDTFRPVQTDNIRWLFNLVRAAIARATGEVPGVLTWESGGFDTPLFYELAGAERDIEGWVKLFGATELPRTAAALLARAFEDAVVVIGFELAEVQKRILNMQSVPWIDFNIHPYRFGPDVFFAVQTNHSGVQEALRRLHVEDWRFERHAAVLAAQAVRMPPARPVEERCLVIGQTRVDRALIRDGHLVDLRDFAAPLHVLIGRSDRVLFKPHPYNTDGFGMHDIGLPLRRIREMTENVYVLLAQPAVERVVGVSSSVVTEARFFGKDGIFLGAPPLRVAPTRRAFAADTFASVLQPVVSADLWRDLLEPLVPVTGRDGDAEALPPNTLRNSLRQFWGYDEIAFQLPFDLAAQRAEERRVR